MATAFTTIVHGNEDGSITRIEEGEPVKGLPKEVVESLKAQDLVGTVASVEKVEGERDELLARVAELEAKLREARGEGTQAVAPPTPKGGTAEDSAKKPTGTTAEQPKK